MTSPTSPGFVSDKPLPPVGSDSSPQSLKPGNPVLKAMQKPALKRPPSLNELVARINPDKWSQLQAEAARGGSTLLGHGPTSPQPSIEEENAAAAASGTPNSRLRLPGKLLSRTNSSTTPSPPASEGSEALAAPAPASEGYVKGYKAVPSLAALQARYNHPTGAPAKGAEGAEGMPTLEAAAAAGAKDAPSRRVSATEDEAEGAGAGKGEHPLQHVWTLFYDSKSSKPPQTPLTAGAASPSVPPTPTAGPMPTDKGTYEAGLSVVGEFRTVESFCRTYNWCKPPSKLERNSNYHLFKDGVKPMWEDSANAAGGKWVIQMRGNPALLDRSWTWLVMGLVGEELDEKDEVTGAVVSTRPRGDRLQLWTRGTEPEAINGIGKRLIKLLEVEHEPGVSLEFQWNTGQAPAPNKYISIAPTPAHHQPGPSLGGGSAPNSLLSSRSSTPSGVAGGADSPMGAFGGSGSSWRSAGPAARGGMGMGGAMGGAIGLGISGGGGGQPRSGLPPQQQPMGGFGLGK